jgi:hypothetical protein
MIEVTFNAIASTKFHPNAPIGSNCTLLRSLNVRHSQMVEAAGINSMESRSSSMSSSPYKISSKSTNHYKIYTTSEV